MEYFSNKTKEELGYYVYCLVDPNDNKIFYIGEGSGDRVFNHARNAIECTESSLKLEKIRSIIEEGKTVKYYIIRHKLDKETAFMVESTLINLLTYKNFNTESILTNIQVGHHQWNEGIKTTEEIEQLYTCEDLILNNCQERIMFVKLNQTAYKHKKNKEESMVCESIYESTRKWWKGNPKRMDKVDYVMGVFQGIVRTVYKPKKNEEGLNILQSTMIKNAQRYAFVCDDPENKTIYQDIVDKYLNKHLVYQDKIELKEFMACQKEFRYWK